jgi:hypothetical protein
VVKVQKSSTTTQHHHHHPPAWAHFVGGGLGAMVGGVLTSPLEVVKTRLQGTYNKEGLANTQHRFGTRTVRALTHLHAEGGVRALYRGMVPHLVGVVPSRALYFGTFSWSKRELAKHFALDPHGMLLNWLGGAAAGNVPSPLNCTALRCTALVIVGVDEVFARRATHHVPQPCGAMVQVW